MYPEPRGRFLRPNAPHPDPHTGSHVRRWLPDFLLPHNQLHRRILGPAPRIRIRHPLRRVRRLRDHHTINHPSTATPIRIPYHTSRHCRGALRIDRAVDPAAQGPPATYRRTSHLGADRLELSPRTTLLGLQSVQRLDGSRVLLPLALSPVLRHHRWSILCPRRPSPDGHVLLAGRRPVLIRLPLRPSCARGHFNHGLIARGVHRNIDVVGPLALSPSSRRICVALWLLRRRIHGALGADGNGNQR